MPPILPENINTLSVEQLRELSAAIKEWADPIVNGTPTVEELAEVATFVGVRKEALALIRQAKTLADLSTDLADEDVVEDEVEDEVDETEETDLSTDDETEESEEKELAAVGAKGKKVSAFGDNSTPTPSSKKVTPDVLKKYSNGRTVAETFDSWSELADALTRAASDLSPNAEGKHYVATIPGRFGEGRVLNDESQFNLQSFENEVMAAMCAPLIPVYDLACSNTTRRPVANSLPAWRLDARGGVTIYPSPSLSDITGGTGVWTYTDDADPDAVKNACQTIECAESEEFRIYGVYRCITIKNLLAMTFPELVEAYLNRLAAAHARLAETQLLEAMATGCEVVQTLQTGYNATTRIQSAILNYIALYQEEQRWDVDGLLEAWMPRWVVKAIQMDMVRRRRHDGMLNTVPSEAQVTAMFRSAGVNPHYFIDKPSWATALPTLQTAGQLNQLPRNLEILVAPPGKFALMDRGELRIGVTGNNIYRDKTDLMANQFTMFWENFEGIVNTNTCPAHIIELDNLCYNGVQAADVAVGCEGTDYPGVGS